MTKTIAEVLAEHPDWWWGRTEGKAHCDKCEWSQSCDPRTADNTFRAHQAAALSAAGFGLVAEKPLRITQELLDAQRAKGWTDWHPEDYCHKCFESNVSWFVDTQPWTNVMRGGNPEGWGQWQEIICIPCFTALADAHYGEPQAWTITRDRSSYHLTRADGLVADAGAKALEDAAEALEMQGPKLKSQYVDTLRLYAAEPWRMETKPRKASNDDQ